MLTVNLTSLGQGSGCGHLGPHGERSGSQEAMMHRLEQVSPHAKEILNDTVDV